jgi:hypothetical protein
MFDASSCLFHTKLEDSYSSIYSYTPMKLLSYCTGIIISALHVAYAHGVTVHSLRTLRHFS